MYLPGRGLLINIYLSRLLSDELKEPDMPKAVIPEAPPLERLRAHAGTAAELLKTLANPERLLLLCQLVEGERSVGELETQLGIRQPTLSQQLGILRREQLVQTRREGKQVYYRLASPEATAVLETLYRLYCAPESKT
jgi:DNA-binding transcriptional ArsR family regulator